MGYNDKRNEESKVKSGFVGLLAIAVTIVGGILFKDTFSNFTNTSNGNNSNTEGTNKDN